MSEVRDEMSLLSDIDDDSISNPIIDQMDIDEIADYIDQNFHEFTSIPWTSELLIPSSINDEECKEQNILKHMDSKNPKQTKKRNVDTFKVYLNPKKYSSTDGYDSNSFQKLSKDLTNTSVACGFSVVKNGTRK